jgi:cell division protein FtsB
MTVERHARRHARQRAPRNKELPMNATRDLEVLDTLGLQLRTLAELHQELLTLAQSKRTAIVKGELAELEALVAREQALIGEVEKENRQRELAMKLAREALGMAEGEGRLRDVLAKAGETWRVKIEPLRARLVEIVEAVRYQARLNTELIKSSVAHAESFLKALQSVGKTDLTYSRGGRKNGGGPSILDRSA